MQIQHHSRELRDLVLLQVPEKHTLEATASMVEQPSKIDAMLIPAAVLHFKWPADSDLDVKGIIRKTADTYTKAHLLTYKMVTSSSSISAFGLQEQTKSTTVILKWGSNDKIATKGEPIPSSLPYASIHVADDVYSIVTDNGVDFSVLKNGEEIAGSLPSVGFALGTMFTQVLPELAQKGSDGAATTELTKDFIYAVAQMLVEGEQLDDAAKRYLKDFVELATNKDFAAGGA